MNDNGSDNTNDTPLGAMVRYDVTPTENGYRVEYCFVVDGYTIYYIYLGKVDNVPIAYETAQKYDGRSPIELTYSTAYTTEEQISKSSQTCVSQTVGSTVSSKNSKYSNVIMGFEAGDPLGIAKIRGSVEMGWGMEWGNTYSDSNSISKTDTYASFSKWAKTVSSTYRITVGMHGEDAGYYRYTLFATCDAFATVVVDDDNNECYYDYAMLARADSYYMYLDYSGTNEFTSGDDLVKLKLTDYALESLPAPPETEDPWTLDLTGAESTKIGTITVPVDTDHIRIIGDPSNVLSMNIVISPRHADLKIVLVNVKFIAPQGMAAIKDESASASAHTIVIEIIGDNVIVGGSGGSGVDGRAGIDVGTKHSVSVTGRGNLTVSGGNGGSGSTGMKGGNGGYGIYCKTVSFGNAFGNITVMGGHGGNGGSGADNHSLFGVGGNGGRGGNGNYAIAAIEPPTDTPYKPMLLVGGGGGYGGNGGCGGWGGNSGASGSGGDSKGLHLWYNIEKKGEVHL
jgi:hypothetical protein